MFKKIAFSLIICSLVLAVNLPVFTQAAANQATAQAVDAGNKICPVSGDKIDERLKATYEYNGKIYNFCCAACIDDFKKDPEKYIEKVNAELKAAGREAVKEEKQATPEPQMPMETHGGHQH